MKLGSVWKNPVEIFCIPLELMRTRLQELGMEIPEKHFVLQVLKNLPKEYDIQCQVMRIKLSTRKLSLQSMYNHLELRYDDPSSTKTSCKNGHSKSVFLDNDSDCTKGSTSRTEDALLPTQFKGRCRKCGQYRHKGADFPEHKTESCTPSTTGSTTTKFKGNCHYCGKKGHKEVECCKKKRDLESENVCKESG